MDGSGSGLCVMASCYISHLKLLCFAAREDVILYGNLHPLGLWHRKVWEPLVYADPLLSTADSLQLELRHPLSTLETERGILSPGATT